MTPVKGQIQPNFIAAYGSGYTVVVTRNCSGLEGIRVAKQSCAAN